MKQFEIDALVTVVNEAIAKSTKPLILKVAELESKLVEYSNIRKELNAANSVLESLGLKVLSVEDDIKSLPREFVSKSDIDATIGAVKEHIESVVGSSATVLEKKLAESVGSYSDKMSELYGYVDAKAALASTSAISEIRGELEKSIYSIATSLPDFTGFVKCDELAQEVAEINQKIEKAHEELQLNSETLVELSVASVKDEIKQVQDSLLEKVNSLNLTVDVNSFEIPYYADGEVVRAGVMRRFGIGGVCMAVVDTARGAHAAPGDWRTIVDGHSPVPMDDGVLYRSLSGNTDFVIKHGEPGPQGREGQRGKTGSGLPGKNGVGIEQVEVTETGLAIIMTDGKVAGIDLSQPLARAVEDVSGLIDFKIENKVVQLLSNK